MDGMRYLKLPLIAIFIALLGILFFPGQGNTFDTTDGIRFGVFSIHPSVLASIRWVDNIYFVPNDYKPDTPYDVPQRKESDFIVNTQPSIMFDITIPTFTIQAGYRFYNDHHLGYDDPDNNHHKLNASNHTVNGLLDYHAPFGLILKLQDEYTSQEAFENSDEYVDFLQGEQSHNDARGTLGYTHGPEENIYVAYTYINILDEYIKYDEFNKMSHMHNGELKFKFFPRTAFMIEGGYRTADYEKIQDFDMQAYWGMAGLKGQITQHFVLTAKGGYTYYDYQENSDGHGPLADVELAFVWPSKTKLSFGYRRRFKDAINTNFYTSDEGYMFFTRLWASRVNTSLFGSYMYNLFSEPLDRREDFVQVNLDITLRLVFWLYAGCGYQLDYKIVDDKDAENITHTIRNTALFKLIAQF